MGYVVASQGEQDISPVRASWSPLSTRQTLGRGWGAGPPQLPALTGVGRGAAKGGYLKREVFIGRGVQHVADLESKQSH